MLKPAEAVCPVFSPSTCSVLSHSRPLRFCCVMPFRVSDFLAVHMVFRRFTHDDGARNHRQIAGGGELPRRIQPVYRFEMGVLQAQLRALVHQLDEVGPLPAT